MHSSRRLLPWAVAAWMAGLLPGSAQITVVPLGADWIYMDDGSDQGTAWREINFDDSGWYIGPAELGYGDGDEATVVLFGPEATNKYPTTYFRISTNLPNGSAIHNLEMNLLRDDGAVVYVNGIELWRDNMPVGSIGFETPALAALSPLAEYTVLQQTIATGTLLQDGTNVVAVEIHQQNPASSDISFDLTWEPVTNTTFTELQRGPYLQFGTPTSAVVCWRTDLATDSRVVYGDAPGNLVFTQIVSGARTDHAVTMDTLTPDTTYYYAVGDASGLIAGGDSNHLWITHPVPGSIRPSRIWVLGDSGEANQHAQDVRDAFYAWSGDTDPDLWLMLGDNAYGIGSDSQYQEAVFEIYPDTLLRRFLWSTMGNHDGISAFSVTETGPYYDIFHFPTQGEVGGVPSMTEAWYSFDYANIHFIYLNSYDVSRTTNGAMYGWLESDLAMTDRDWLIAFWHHPPYTKGSHNSDTETRLVEMRQNLLPLLEEWGVDLVLCGHSHAYERSAFVHGHYGHSTNLTAAMVIDGGSGREGDTGVYDKTATNGAVYAVAGSSSKISGGNLNHPLMYLSLNELGSLVLDVNSNRLDATFLGDTPTVLDAFTILKTVDSRRLTTSVQEPGEVIPPGGDFSLGTEVPLVAVPSNFYSFTAWSNDLSGAANPGTLVLDADKDVTAIFETYQLPFLTHCIPGKYVARTKMRISAKGTIRTHSVHSGL